MSNYKSFAVAGAGLIGTPIVTALLKNGLSVVVLARAQKDVPAGASVAIVDYTDVPALTATLKTHNVDVVVSTLSIKGLAAQFLLADAAKAAGVHLFIPSEFGPPTEGTAIPEYMERDAFVEHLVSIGLPYVRIYNGWFMGLLPWGLHITESGSAHIVGAGTAPISTTAEEDIGGFIAYVTTKLPLAEYANKSLRIEGDRASMREIAALLNKPIIEHDVAPPDFPPFLTVVLPLIDMGGASTGFDWATKTDLGSAGSANALWAGHHWKTIKEYYNL